MNKTARTANLSKLHRALRAYLHYNDKLNYLNGCLNYGADNDVKLYEISNLKDTMASLLDLEIKPLRYKLGKEYSTISASVSDRYGITLK